MHMRQEHPLICGRDHIAYRSAYFPVKGFVQDAIDVDLCEKHPTLPPDLQKKIADEFDRTPGEILKELEDLTLDSYIGSFAKSNQEALRRILIIFAKLNPGIRYVQGINEVLATLFYVFRNDPDEDNG